MTRVQAIRELSRLEGLTHALARSAIRDHTPLAVYQAALRDLPIPSWLPRYAIEGLTGYQRGLLHYIQDTHVRWGWPVRGKVYATWQAIPISERSKPLRGHLFWKDPIGQFTSDIFS